MHYKQVQKIFEMTYLPLWSGHLHRPLVLLFLPPRLRSCCIRCVYPCWVRPEVETGPSCSAGVIERTKFTQIRTRLTKLIWNWGISCWIKEGTNVPSCFWFITSPKTISKAHQRPCNQGSQRGQTLIKKPAIGWPREAYPRIKDNVSHVVFLRRVQVL